MTWQSFHTAWTHYSTVTWLISHSMNSLSMCDMTVILHSMYLLSKCDMTIISHGMYYPSVTWQSFHIVHTHSKCDMTIISHSMYSLSKCDMTVISACAPASRKMRMISKGAFGLRPGWMMAGLPSSLWTAAALLKERFSKSENTELVDKFWCDFSCVNKSMWYW